MSLVVHPPAPSSACGAKSCCAQLYELPITTIVLGDSFHPGGAALTKRLGQAAIIARDSRVLDVASGIGTSARVLAEQFGCTVVGVDYSAKNVALANQAAKDAGLAHKVSFVRGDAEALPFAAQTFDVVVCECALCTFPNMAIAVEEMRRVLRPGGRVAISDMVVNAAIPAALDNVMGHVLCITGALSAQGYRDALLVGGFGAVRYRDVSHVLVKMIDDIQRRIGRARELAEAGRIEWPASLDNPGPTLHAARAFVASGGVGYALLTGRKPWA